MSAPTSNAPSSAGRFSLKLLALAVSVAAADLVVHRGRRRSALRLDPAAVRAADLQQPVMDVASATQPAYRQPFPRIPARRLASGLGLRVATRVRAWGLDGVLVTTLAAVIGVVHAWGMGRSPAFFDDEGTYVSQAYAVDKLHSLAPYTYWYDHPPLGWILLAGWAKLVPTFGASSISIAAARTFILVLVILSTALLYGIARRLGVRPLLAAFATLLFGLSPLALHYQRMVLLDNIAVAWLLAAFFFALSPRRRLGAYAASAVCLAGAGLTKETFLLFLPAIALAIWNATSGSNRRFAIGLFGTLLFFTAGFFPLFAVLRGELFEGAHHTSLMYGIRFQLSRTGGGSILDSSSGTRSIIRTWLDYDPILLAFGVPLAPFVLRLRQFRPLGLALAIPLILILRPGGYVPAMYIIGILPFAALAIAAMVEHLIHRLDRDLGSYIPWRRHATLAAAVFLIAVPTALAAPRWESSDASQLHANDVSASTQAVDWLSAHASRKSRLLVDDTIWTDLLERGFQQQRTVWFYKLDLDPAVREPWWKFDYVVRSNIIAGNTYWLPRTREVIRHSKLVVVFTTATERFEIRRVIHPAAGG